MKFFFFIIVLLLPVYTASAYEVRTEARAVTAGVNSDFVIDVKLAARDSVNACEGYILFDSDSLEVISFLDGNSVMNFWIEKPTVAENSVHFSGVTPGGFSGQDNFLFGIVFRAKHAGIYTFVPEMAAVYAHDGSGKRIEAKVHPISVSIDDGISNIRNEVDDNEAPEDFTPYFLKDPSMYDGKNVLVFSTQDKGTGVSHYLLREGKYGFYKNVSSPYVLKDQDLHRTIYIQAHDLAGNIRTVVIPSKNTQFSVSHVFIILLLSFLGSVLFTTLWKKFRVTL